VWKRRKFEGKGAVQPVPVPKPVNSLQHAPKVVTGIVGQVNKRLVFCGRALVSVSPMRRRIDGNFILEDVEHRRRMYIF